MAELYQSSDDNLGGAITANTDVETLNEIFDGVTADETLNGLTTYRCLYVKNDNPVIPGRTVGPFTRTYTAVKSWKIAVNSERTNYVNRSVVWADETTGTVVTFPSGRSPTSQSTSTEPDGDYAVSRDRGYTWEVHNMREIEGNWYNNPSGPEWDSYKSTTSSAHGLTVWPGGRWTTALFGTGNFGMIYSDDDGSTWTAANSSRYYANCYNQKAPTAVNASQVFWGGKEGYYPWYDYPGTLGISNLETEGTIRVRISASPGHFGDCYHSFEWNGRWFFGSLDRNQLIENNSIPTQLSATLTVTENVRGWGDWALNRATGSFIVAQRSNNLSPLVEYDLVTLSETPMTPATVQKLTVDSGYAQTLYNSIGVGAGDGIFVMVVGETVDSNQESAELAVLISEDGITWSDPTLVALPSVLSGGAGGTKGVISKAVYAGDQTWVIAYRNSANKYELGHIAIQTNGVYYEDMTATITAQPTSGAVVSIGLGTSGVNGVEQSIGTRTQVPSGITFDTSLELPDLGPEAYHAIWVKRTVTFGAATTPLDGCTIEFDYTEIDPQCLPYDCDALHEVGRTNADAYWPMTDGMVAAPGTSRFFHTGATYGPYDDGSSGQYQLYRRRGDVHPVNPVNTATIALADFGYCEPAPGGTYDHWFEPTLAGGDHLQVYEGGTPFIPAFESYLSRNTHVFQGEQGMITGAYQVDIYYYNSGSHNLSATANPVGRPVVDATEVTFNFSGGGATATPEVVAHSLDLTKPYVITTEISHAVQLNNNENIVFTGVFTVSQPGVATIQSTLSTSIFAGSYDEVRLGAGPHDLSLGQSGTDVGILAIAWGGPVDMHEIMLHGLERNDVDWVCP